VPHLLITIIRRCRVETDSNCDAPEHVDSSQAGIYSVTRGSDNRDYKGLLDRMSNIRQCKIIVIKVLDCADSIRIGLDHHSGCAV
jgi:hypothetical protein